jgi:hypothetical protein
MIGMWANVDSQMQAGYIGVPPYLHSPFDAAEQLCFEVVYTNGSINDSTVTVNMTQDTLTIGDISAIVLYFGGIDSCIEGEAMDRYFVAWSPAQLDLNLQNFCSGKAIHRDRSKWVVSQMTFRFSRISISQLSYAGYSGQDGGPAVFAILIDARNFANVSPCLRICGQGVACLLPLSQYRMDDHLGLYIRRSPVFKCMLQILARSLIDIITIHFDSIQLLRGWKPFVVPVPLLIHCRT